MKFKHHITRKFQDAKEAPLWQWVIVILLVIAMPLFYLFVNMSQTQRAINTDNHARAESNNKDNHP